MKNKTILKFSFSIIIMLAFLHLPALAQEPGIHFEHGLSWKAVQEKAKKENKFIFVDCYTTWCGPCKMMSQEIFPLKEVGDFFNKHFVSVKVQFDKTPKDNEEVKAWYEGAAYFEKEYKVLAYPTFLYFTPEGKLVHLYVGGTKDPAEFIAASRQSLDPATQHFTKMEVLVQQAEKDPSTLKAKALEAKANYDGLNASRLAQAYLKHVKDLYTKENLQFLDQFTKHSSDESFKVYLEHADKINAVLGKGAAQKKIGEMAFMETGASEWLDAKTPEGAAAVKQKMREQFPSMAGMLTDKLDVFYAQLSGNNETFANAVVPYVKKYSEQISSQELTAYARNLGRKGDTRYLQIALEWSKQAWEQEQSEGTAFVYASMLYRNGAKENAIAMQKKVLGFVAGNKGAESYYQDVLTKMEKGQQL
jgi:thioredoxin-related protein